MLGISLRATVFRAYARTYDVHRRRMAACLEEFGAKVRLPRQHREFVAKHDGISEAVVTDLDRVSPAGLGWMLFGSTLIDFGAKRAFRMSEAKAVRRGLALFLDKVSVSRRLLSRYSRKCHREKDGTLSLYRLHSAALALLNEIISRLPRERRTAFVAMPFSVPRMAKHYAKLYLPVLKSLRLNPLRAWGGFGTEDYQDLLYALIDRCGAMLGDITTLNPNVMHEVGYALGKGDKFIIIIAEKGQSVPANLGDVSVLTYRAKGRTWQARAVAEIVGAVALYEYAAALGSSGRRPQRIVGPLKVTA